MDPVPEAIASAKVSREGPGGGSVGRLQTGGAEQDGQADEEAGDADRSRSIPERVAGCPRREHPRESIGEVGQGTGAGDESIDHRAGA